MHQSICWHFPMVSLDQRCSIKTNFMSHFSFSIWTVFCLHIFMSMLLHIQRWCSYCIAYLRYIDRWPSTFHLIAFIVNSQFTKRNVILGPIVIEKLCQISSYSKSYRSVYISDQQATWKIWTCIMKETLWLLFLFYNIKEAENNVTNTKLLYM